MEEVAAGVEGNDHELGVGGVGLIDAGNCCFFCFCLMGGVLDVGSCLRGRFLGSCAFWVVRLMLVSGVLRVKFFL